MPTPTNSATPKPAAVPTPAEATKAAASATQPASKEYVVNALGQKMQNIYDRAKNPLVKAVLFPFVAAVRSSNQKKQHIKNKMSGKLGENARKDQFQQISHARSALKQASQFSTGDWASIGDALRVLQCYADLKEAMGDENNVIDRIGGRASDAVQNVMRILSPLNALKNEVLRLFKSSSKTKAEDVEATSNPEHVDEAEAEAPRL